MNQTVWLENLYRDTTLVWGVLEPKLHSVSWDPHNNNQGWKEDSLRNSLRSLGLASKSPAAAAKTSFSCSYLWNGTFQRRGQQQAKSLVNMNFSNYSTAIFSFKMGFDWFLWVFQISDFVLIWWHSLII